MISLKTKISTPQWRECQAFYEQTFGMIVAEAWDEPADKGVILALRDGRSEAYLELYDTRTTHDLSGLSLQFKVDDADAFVRGLSSNVSYEGPKARPWGSRYVYLRDPAGVSVIVFEGGL